MCGIVGYLGRKSVVPLLVNSLRHLEYRGYDSAGVAYLDDLYNIHIHKAAGKLINLERVLPENIVSSNGSGLHLGIGHIRWATHGAATDINAHPHISFSQEIALVHNGIIENYAEIREQLKAKGYAFISETDTECVVHLLEDLSKDEPDFCKVIQKALQMMDGAYAISVINRKYPDRLYAIRNKAPLVVGVGEGEYIVASDAVAMVEHTPKIIYLKDREIAEISLSGVKVMTIDGEPVTPVVETITMGPLQIDKKGYKHFMLKEIYEQPDVVRNALLGRISATNEPVRLFTDEMNQRALENILGTVNRIVVVGCGSSFNAGLVGKYFIEELVRVPVEVEAAGEYRYRNPIIDDKSLVILISQSGETADTLEALRQSAQRGAKTVAVTNREDSTIAREADFVLPVRAGVEVSVCATKSFLAQIMVLYLIGLTIAERRNSVQSEQLVLMKAELLKVPAQLEAMLSETEAIQAMAKRYGNARDVLFIARGINYPVALEGALKLKEISYIHAEGYSGSELKHGPIAMLDDSIPIISILVPGIVFEKMVSNCQEAKARDPHVVAVTSAEIDENFSGGLFEQVVTIPRTLELLSPLITTVPLQLLSYYIAEHLGKDVDQPRNLAKSVTVE